MAVEAGFLLPHPPMIIPEIGLGREKQLPATIKRYNIIARRIAAIAPETVIIISPHSTVYSDYFHISPGKGAEGSLEPFGAAHHFEAVYDERFARSLEKHCSLQRIPAGGVGEAEPELDHGVMIPLYYFGRYTGNFRLVRVSPSGLSREDHYRFGMLIAKTANELKRKVVVVASGDLSHTLSPSGPYGFAPEGPVFDEAMTGIIASGAFSRLFEVEDALCDKAAECAFLPMIMLAGALDGKALRCGLLSYEKPFGVGYAIGAFEIEGIDMERRFLKKRKEAISSALKRLREREDDYVRLAREALESYVRNGSLPPLPMELSAELVRARSGVFVTIKRNGQLRGCIGTTAPAQDSLAEEIRMNAVSAGTADPRFAPVDESELGELVYSVDVLFPPEPAKPGDLNPARYGVIVSSGRKKGLLLPDLESVDTAEEQLAIAKNKAGIPEDKPFKLERFEVVRHQ